MGRIVVGVDGSEGSIVALRWALEEARLREATVDAVHTWEYPYVGELAGMAAFTIDRDELERAAREVLTTSIDHAGPTSVPVKPILAYGPAASVLLDAAKGADLLVVGSRGRGGFAGLLLGSVSQQCAHHAPCPVEIVPAPAART
jgi:nucleotide-binding universal stress UspA family protein